MSDTETEVRALVAAALQRALNISEGVATGYDRAGDRAIATGIRLTASQVRILLDADHAAALEAVKAQALEHVALAFENVDAQIEENGAFSERSWEQLRAAIRSRKAQP